VSLGPFSLDDVDDVSYPLDIFPFSTEDESVVIGVLITSRVKFEALTFELPAPPSASTLDESRTSQLFSKFFYAIADINAEPNVVSPVCARSRVVVLF
jgi:hypothetical protein